MTPERLVSINHLHIRSVTFVFGTFVVSCFFIISYYYFILFPYESFHVATEANRWTTFPFGYNWNFDLGTNENDHAWLKLKAIFYINTCIHFIFSMIYIEEPIIFLTLTNICFIARWFTFMKSKIYIRNSNALHLQSSVNNPIHSYKL